MHAAQSNMRMHHPDVNIGQQLSTDQNSSKSAITFALPMYTVGIAVFFIYTCFKVCQKNLILFNKSYIYVCLFSIGETEITKKIK